MYLFGLIGKFFDRENLFFYMFNGTFIDYALD